MIRRPAAGALALACIALAGCETTQEKSAKLEKAAKRRAVASSESGLHVVSPSRTIRAVSTTVLTGEVPTAAVIVRNGGPAQRDVPIEISIPQSGGDPYTNTEAGLARSLISLAYVPAHGSAAWVDDQVALTGAPGTASVKVGEGRPAASPPRITIVSYRLESEGSGEAVAAEVRNESAIEQRELTVYALARRGSRIVAAGRAVVSTLAPGATATVHVFLTGSAHGATLSLSAPASIFG